MMFDALRSIFPRRLAVIAALFAVPIVLGGCLDLDNQITFKNDGLAAIDLNLQFDEGVEDIAAFLDAIGQRSPEAAKFERGVCAFPQKAFEDGGNPEIPVRVTAQQITIGGKYICQVRATFATADFLAKNEIPPDSPFQVKAAGERRVRISLNLSSVPDFTAEAQEELSKNLGLLGEVPGAQAPDSQAANELWRKSQAAMLAFSRLALREGYAQFTIKSPRILESNGQIDPSGTQAKFKFTWTELTELALFPEKRRDKNFFAVVEY